jgi:hypothetical protein
MKNNSRRYSGPNLFTYIVWEWKSFLWFRWGYARKQVSIIPDHINCRCSLFEVNTNEI